MTRAEARRRAVEAVEQTAAHQNAIREMYLAFNMRHADPLVVVVNIYIAAMADAGWRMVRVVDRMPWPNYEEYAERTAGWNACRAAMLEEEP